MCLEYRRETCTGDKNLGRVVVDDKLVMKPGRLTIKGASANHKGKKTTAWLWDD
jgi:hypothetical protein